MTPFARHLELRTIPEPDSGCWLWTGNVHRNGYGRVQLRDGGKRSWLFVHRASWEHHHGDPIPKGMCVCHKCDVRICVNPAHLFLGTNGDNNRDRSEKERTARQNGETNGFARLTDAAVLAIRNDWRTQTVIAAHYGVAQSTISQVQNRRRWRHI